MKSRVIKRGILRRKPAVDLIRWLKWNYNSLSKEMKSTITLDTTRYVPLDEVKDHKKGSIDKKSCCVSEKMEL